MGRFSPPSPKASEGRDFVSNGTEEKTILTAFVFVHSSLSCSMSRSVLLLGAGLVSFKNV